MKQLFTILYLALFCTQVQAYYLADASLSACKEGIRCELKLQPQQEVFRVRVRLVWQAASTQASLRESAFVFHHPDQELEIQDLCPTESMERLLVKIYLQLDKERAKLVETLEY